MSMMIHRAVQRQRRREKELNHVVEKPVEKAKEVVEVQEEKNSVAKRGRKPKR